MLEPGQLVDGKYRVERLLGKGGMGAVFEGFHTLVDRRVAIKVLLPSATSSEHALARFEREVRATGRIGNDHILEVYDVGSLPDGSRYMVSEFLNGETLADRLSRGPLQPKAVAELTLQLLDGLDAAHAKGIVHRDLKPENLFLLHRKADRSDFLKIIDFGISKFQQDDMSEMSMTATGTVLGTPYYLSPEQARGQRDIDHRSDLYAVGVIMYESVTGRVPFNAENFNDLLFKIALESPRPLAEVMQIDPVFSAIVQRAMGRQREERYQSAREMQLALSQWLQLPVSGELVPAPALSAELKNQWKTADTLTASRHVVTDSNFGLTTAPSFRRRSRWGVVLASAAVLGVAGVAAFLISGAGEGDDAAPAVSTTTATTPRASATLPSVEPRPVVTPSEPTRAEDSEPMHAPVYRPELPAADEGRELGVSPAPRTTAPARRVQPRATQRPRPATPATPRPNADPPAGDSPPSAPRRRDFGY